MIKITKFSKFLIMSLTVLLLIGFSNISYATDFPTVGFYVNHIEGNVYFDIYTFLNNQELCMNKINEAGLKNVIFIHQTGEGNVLKEILFEYNFKDLIELNFEDIYIDIITGEEIQTGFDVFKVLDIY